MSMSQRSASWVRCATTGRAQPTICFKFNETNTPLYPLHTSVYIQSIYNFSLNEIVHVACRSSIMIKCVDGKSICNTNKINLLHLCQPVVGVVRGHLLPGPPSQTPPSHLLSPLRVAMVVFRVRSAERAFLSSAIAFVVSLSVTAKAA